MKTPIICLVTDGRGHFESTLERVGVAAAAGVNLIQIREPQLPDRRLRELVRAACERAAGTDAAIVVNDRLDIALAAGAQGVHLGGRSFSAARARLIAGSPLLMGRSVHTLEEAAAVEREGACDYLIFGTIFPSPSKPEGHRTAGLAALRDVCSRVRLPVVAIGGVTRNDLADIAATGAAGVAAISLFADLDALAQTADLVRRAFDTRSPPV